MRRQIGWASLALLGGCMMAEPPRTQGQHMAQAEAELAAATAGRQAGQPVSSVSLRQLGSNRSVGGDLILFEGQGPGRIYLNRARGCEALRHGRALVIRSTTGQLCQGDIVEVADPVTGVTHGSCSIGEFLPYSSRR